MQARTTTGTLLLCIVVSGLSLSANAQAPACDSGCLKGFVDGYIQALARRDSKDLPVAEGVKYTENGRVLDLGDGFWHTAGAPLRYRDYLLDPDTGQAAALTALKEYEGIAQMAVRLKIVNRKITEIETLVARVGDQRWFAPDNLEHMSDVFAQPVASAERPTREQLVAAATAYFNAIQTEGTHTLKVTADDLDGRHVEKIVSFRIDKGDKIVMNFRLVLFDFDGTLADSMMATINIFQTIGPELGLMVTGDENVRQAREKFGVDIGVATDVGVAGDMSFEAITRQLLSQCKPAPSIEERTDVVAARERVHLARVNTWDVKTQFFPTLTLQSNLSTTTQLTGQSPSTLWSVQGVLAWNIWDGGARYGNLRDAKLQVLEAQDRLDATRRAAVIQVVQTDRGVLVAQESRDVADRARNLAAEVDRLTRAGFMTGQGTSLDLVTAAAALRQAEINLAINDYSLIKARILAVLSLASCPL